MTFKGGKTSFGKTNRLIIMGCDTLEHEQRQFFFFILLSVDSNVMTLTCFFDLTLLRQTEHRLPHKLLKWLLSLI